MTTYEKVGLRTQMRFTSMSYTNIEWVSPSFRHKMSGRDLLRSHGQIRAVKLALDLFCRTFVFLASGSIELWAWSWNCHVLLWIQWAKTPGTGMEELGMGMWRDANPSTTPTSLSAAFTRQELARSRDNGWDNAGKSQVLGLNNEQGPVSFLRNRNSSLCTLY